MPRQKKKDTRGYLERLTFNPELGKTFIAKYLVNIRLVALLMISIVTFGIFGFTQLSRRVNPEINIPIIFVSTVLPGAGPSDVESLVTIPLEDKIESVQGINTLTSTSQDNVSFISIEFDSDIDPDEAKADVQSAIDTVNDLPDDATDPSVIALDFEDVPVWTFAMTADSAKNVPSLFRTAEKLQDELESGSLIKNVIVTGLEKQEIQILIDPEKVEEFGINPFLLSQTVSSQLQAFPAGIIQAHGSNFSLTVDPLISTVEDIRNIEISLEGQTYILSDIAIVQERSAPDQANSYIAESDSREQRAVTFSVFKLQSSDIDKTSEQAQTIAESFMKQQSDSLHITSINNSGELIKEQFNDLFSNLTATIFLVFLTLFAFLGIKQATIASLSIPLAFLISFGIMLVTGLSINFLTMFSLILALGLVVDDAIVVISSMTTYYKTGKFTPEETGILVWKDFIVPIWTTTLTTVWAFLPLLLSTGIIGNFIKSIPIVVSSVLLSSTSVAVLITLPLMIVILKPRVPRRVQILLKAIVAIGMFVAASILLNGNPLKPLILLLGVVTVVFTIQYRYLLWKRIVRDIERYVDTHTVREWIHETIFHGFIDPVKLTRKYTKIIDRILHNRKLRIQTIAAVIILFVFAVALVPLGFVKNEFFPKTNEDTIYASLELPSGTDLTTTETEALRLLNELKDTPETEFVTLELGRQIDSGSTDTQITSNRARFTISLDKKRNMTSIEIADLLREQFAQYAKGTFNIIEESGGPPVGADVQIKLSGNDLGVLDTYADRVVEYMESQPGLTNVEKSIKPGVSKLVFEPSREKLVEYGLSVQDIAGWMRTFVSGLDIDETTITTNEKQNIVFRMNTDVQSPESLARLVIQTPRGKVPLLELGTLELRTKPTSITREDGNRTLSVSASARQGFNIPDMSTALSEYADTDLQLPSGYTWSTGGVNEENQASVNSILQAMVLAFILIFGTMVIQLSSFRKAFIVLLVIPLAMSGVFIIFALTGTPLSFPALIGVLALYGIVVNNSIVVVEKINQNLAIDMPFTTAIIDASASRLQPILFSSMTTIIGLFPITITDPLWRGLGGAIIAGLTFSGAVMLLFIPVVYYMIYARDYDLV